MNKVLLIAKRDYLQTVLTKAYLLGLVMLPLLMGGGFLFVALAGRGNNTKDQHIAVIDRTGISAIAVIRACEEASRGPLPNAPNRFQAMPHYVFEEVKPEANEAEQLLDLSNRIRSGELFLVLDIRADAARPQPEKRELVHYYTNSSALNQIGVWLPAAVNDGLRRVRLMQLGIDSTRVSEAMRDVDVVSMNLVTTDPSTGKIIPSEKRNMIQAGGVVSFFLVFLLIMVVILGSMPNLSAVAEDKTQRVFEMLLVSASSFELMMGKVLAALGASLTTSALYIIGGLMVLAGLASFGLAPLDLLPWFFVYLIADVIILSALGVALGSSVSGTQDAQQLGFLLILPIMIPMFMLSPVMQQPNGPLAVAMSFIPPFTPVLMLLRQSLPGGVPWWQPWLGLVGVGFFALATIWAAARIFRIGILSQGKTPKLSELAQWVIHG